MKGEYEMKLIKEIEKSTAFETLSKCDMHNIHNALFEICDNAHALPFDFDAKLQGVVDENDASPLVVDMENSLLIWGSIEIDIESPDVRLFVFIDEDDNKFMHIYTGIHGSRVNMNGVPFRPSIRHLDFAITDDVYGALASENTHSHESGIVNKDEVNVQRRLLLMDLMFPSSCSQNQVKDIMCEALYNLYRYKVDNKDITVVPTHLLPTGDRCFTIRIEMKTDNIYTVDPEKIKRDFNDHYFGVRMITVVIKNYPHEVRGQYQISKKGVMKKINDRCVSNDKIHGSIPDIKETGIYTWQLFMRLQCLDGHHSADDVSEILKDAIRKQCGYNIDDMTIIHIGTDFEFSSVKVIHNHTLTIPENEETVDFINKFDPVAFRKIVEDDGIIIFIGLEIVGTVSKERGNENG